MAAESVYLYMKKLSLFRLTSALALSLVITASASAQDPNPAPVQGQNGSGGYGQRRPGGGMMGGGLMGTVTATAADRYTIRTDAGDVYTVRFTDNTRIMKMPPIVRREGGPGNGGGQGGAQGAGQGNGGGGGGGQGRGMGGNPPQQLKPTDIKVGDMVQVRGPIDDTAKSVPAMFIVVLDPERVAQMRELQANFGKTWLMGRVTAIDGTKVKLTGSMDNVPHSFVADENTTFRQRRDPITLADIQVGDMVRAEGALKDGVFVATSVNSMGAPPPGNTTVPRVQEPLPAPPPQPAPQ